MKLISREQLESIARKTLKYPLQDAEKDYFLGLVMQVVSESDISDDLVFKGGTAIYHCYLDQLRFSEDLDFTSKDKKMSLSDLHNIFREEKLLEVVKDYKSSATLKIERLKYFGVLDTPNSIKFEVDRYQNVALPSLSRKYSNVWGLSFEVNVMDPIEICAEKIRACNDRFRYRDFYDLYMMIHDLNINVRKVFKLIPKKEIRKSISQEQIMNNLNLALEELSEKSDTVSYKEEINKNNIIDFFQKLDVPTHKKNTTM